MGALEINIPEMKRKANLLAQEASNIIQINRNEICNSTDCLMRSWKGDSADRFYVKMDKVEGHIYKHANDLNKLADDLKRKIGYLERAENLGKVLFG